MSTTRRSPPAPPGPGACKDTQVNLRLPPDLLREVEELAATLTRVTGGWRTVHRTDILRRAIERGLPDVRDQVLRLVRDPAPREDE